MLDTVPAVPAVADVEVALSVVVEADKRLPPSEATVLRLPLLTTTVLPPTS